MIDVLIIGSGGAALSAALMAKDEGASVMIVTKAELTNSQTVMAQGGINVALGNVEPDSIESHIEDTLKAAKGLAKTNMIEMMCQEGLLSIAWLEALGVNFSRIEAKEPLRSIAQRKLGGASAKRACYAQDYTGLKIVHTLLDNVLNRNIEIFENHFLLNLIVQDGIVKGAIFLDRVNGHLREIHSKTVIVATGGFGAIYHKHTTNNYGATGDGLVAVLKAGGAVSNMEFVQFHPTGLKNSLVLISESARGEGGYLVNSDNRRFVDELAPRDIVAKAIYEQLKSGKEVYLDMRHLNSKHLHEVMPQELKLCEIYEGVDATKELIPIRPVAHYTMGGVDVDDNLEANNLKHCYCVGEVANAYVHGANRLGGNSLLEIIAFGRVAGVNAANKAKGIKEFEIDESYIRDTQKAIQEILSLKPKECFYKYKNILGDSMFENVGIVRNKEGLQKALQDIKVMQENFINLGVKNKSTKANSELIEFLEFSNMLTLAPIVASMALARVESRGAHIREDYPQTRADFAKSFLFSLGGNNEN